jgi:hypothetical protein
MGRVIMTALLGFLVLALPAAAAKKPQAPVGHITFEATAVGVGATFSWGQGQFTFKGKSYPIKIDGLGLAGVGLSKVRARGKVYNLKHPRDLAGDYAAAEAGIALIGGAKGFVAQNNKGVVIELTAEQKGVSFNLGGGSFTITMPKP